MDAKTKYIEDELKNLLSRFINEIDLSFDYVDKSVIDRLRKMLRKMDNEEEYNRFTNDTLIKLREYEKNISYIMMSKRKLRSVDYDFLNNLVLFNDLLDFKIFKDENKNTKRTICTYLYNIYMTTGITCSICGANNATQVTTAATYCVPCYGRYYENRQR